MKTEGCRADLEHGTIPGLLQHAVERHGPRVAIEDGGFSATFEELSLLAQRAAGALLHEGVQRGDRVGILAPNRWEWIVAALGIHLVGGTLVPINTRFRGPEIADVLFRARVRLLFAMRAFRDADYAAMLVRSGSSSMRVVWFEEFEAFLAQEGSLSAVVARAAEVEGEDVSDLLYTSGTTGRPKGVPSTHGQSLRVFGDWSEIVGLQPGDRYLVVPPFFHTFGYKAGWLACLLRGATVLPQATFDAAEVASRLANDRVTVLPGPPNMYQSLLDRGVGRGTLRLAITGAAVIPPRLVRRIRTELGVETVLTAYGLTESTGVVTMCRRGDSDSVVAETSGRAIPGVEVRIWKGGSRCAEGDAGEIQVRGYNVMRGYVEDDAATQEAFEDGWLRTGDVGTLDAAGNLRITDRLRDMFIVGGFNAYPAEIETVLAGHPLVGEVAVVGVPDPRLGEVGGAFVVLRGPVTETTLLAWASERMANYKVPRRVWFVDALPRNAGGKVLKYQLRERACSTG